MNHHSVFRILAFAAVCLSTSVISAQQTEHASASDVGFPEVYNSETVPGDPISPQEAVQALRLPEGFSATLFAAEPDIQNPIATAMDGKGRVWIAENYTYAERAQKFDLNLNDRVIVLEDVDHDGKADKRTVFLDDVKMLTGITVGLGGVWLMCPPQLLFVPDQDGDLIPDGPPQVKLDGFTVASENYHNFANGLSWGPDSWLYGRCGASCPGELGLPGTTLDRRVPIRGGMWRFHPERKIVEVLTHGTTNPWGHDWNDVGDLFFINTVNGHLWHAIPGAHFVRPHTLDPNPYSYVLIDMHADHWHFDTGKSWTASRDGAANDFGGGHAHIGMMINHADSWPEKYRGRLFTVNMHGRRVNVERLDAEGSGYVGRHEPDWLLSDDTWFRGMDLLPSYDGGVLMIDWSDTGECHDHTGVHRTSGRVFKISYDVDREIANKLPEGVTTEEAMQLAEIAHLGDEWHARRARLALRHLASHSSLVRDEIAGYLRAGILSDGRTRDRLRALWAAVAVDSADDELLVQLLSDPDAHLRVWAVRLLTDNWPLDHGDGNRLGPATLSRAQQQLLDRFVMLAKSDDSAAVRLSLSTVLQRLPPADRVELATALMSHASDASDHNIPLMVWYALSPLGEGELIAELADLASKCQWSQTRQLIIRRVADQCEAHPDLLAKLATEAASGAEQHAIDFVMAVSKAFAGRKKVAEPFGWKELQNKLVASDEEVQNAVRNLSILFGDGRTIDDLIALARSEDELLERRIAAVETLVDSRASGIKQLCMELLDTRFLNAAAARGLASLPDEDVGEALVKAYRRFHPSERSQVVSILASRPAWAQSLLKAVARDIIGRDEISAFQARQIAELGDGPTTDLLMANWGQVRASSAEKRAMIEGLRESLTADRLGKANKSAGRAIFAKSCSACHKLYGEGGALGPDLTGAQRSNIDYLLENVVDPSAVVTTQYRATTLLIEDGRVLTGLLTNKTSRSYTLQTQERAYNIPVDEVVDEKLSANSTMPDGILQQLSQEQIEALFSYLQSTEQVPLP